MSLDWNRTKVKDWEKKVKTKDGRIVCDALIWCTIICGFHSITEQNWKEVYLRIHAYEKVAGPFIQKRMNKKTVGRWITPEDVYNWIGLSTNASSLSLAKFKQRVWKRAIEYVDSNIKQFEKEQKEKNEVSSNNIEG